MNRRTSLKPLVTLGLFIAISAIAVLPMVGCKTPSADQCATYRAVYEAYQATLEIRQPSKEEIMGAKAAAAYLTVTCGWTATKGKDANGVPVIVPPAK